MMLTSKSRNKPLGITIGDPGGIGPEMVAKALAKPTVRRGASFVIIGDKSIYAKYTKKTYPNVQFLDKNIIQKTKSVIGRPTRLGAKASLAYLKTATQLLQSNTISGLITAPVCKETLSKINSTFVGHTELLSNAFNKAPCEMMFVAPRMRTIVVTRHLPLKRVSQSLNKENIFQSISTTHQALKNLFKIKQPFIGVCGLNPHAGEGGTLGREDIEKIKPAIAKTKKKGWRIQGPFPADTLFSPDLAKQYDCIIAMYHDQGLIPIKTLYFHQLVNLTIGLPFVRTSPAHGTAFALAGKNKANPSSMAEAIKLAVKLSR